MAGIGRFGGPLAMTTHARTDHRGGPGSEASFDAFPSPTAAKTLAVLDLLAQSPHGLSAAQAVRGSGITANLVFRILKTLVAAGYAFQHADTKVYTLSGRLLELSGPTVGGESLAMAAHEELVKLRDATGETVQLVIESGGKALVLEQVRGTQALQVCGRVGMRVPLHSCAPGKALLAWWSEADRAGWFRGRKLARFTATTLVDRGSLEAAAATAVKLGYTVDRAEGIDGIHCVAAPVLDPFGHPRAAVTIMAPSARMPEESFPRLGELCRNATRAIERRLFR